MVVSLSKLKAGFSLPPPPPPVSSASLSDGNTWRPGNIRRSDSGLLSEVEVTSDDDRDGSVHQLCLLLLLPLHHVHELSLDDVLPPAPELSVVLAVQLGVLREGGEEGGGRTGLVCVSPGRSPDCTDSTPCRQSSDPDRLAGDCRKFSFLMQNEISQSVLNSPHVILITIITSNMFLDLTNSPKKNRGSFQTEEKNVKFPAGLSLDSISTTATLL